MSGAGLCDDCRFRTEVISARGSRFVLCGRAADVKTYPKYPRLPVTVCAGHEPAAEDPAGPETERTA
ncbi:MAG: hypothetical protein F9K22_09245 [Bacteroidetes bacterium]|nr:MAG: hypothetical protein F9K22_09245 [Bacteroidota bacterium]